MIQDQSKIFRFSLLTPLKKQNWATKWEMSFNASKCKVMHIGKQLGTGPYEYVINGQKLEVVTKEKDLGIILVS